MKTLLKVPENHLQQRLTKKNACKILKILVKNWPFWAILGIFCPKFQKKVKLPTSEGSKNGAFWKNEKSKKFRAPIWSKNILLKGFCIIFICTGFKAILKNLQKRLESAVLRVGCQNSVKHFIYMILSWI